jgi:hypothetical protein
MYKVYLKRYGRYYDSIDYESGEVANGSVSEEEIYIPVKSFNTIDEVKTFINEEIEALEVNHPHNNMGTVTNLVYKHICT